MKKILLTLICLTMVLPVNFALAADPDDDCDGPCETINQIMDDSAKEYREMSQTVMKEYIKEPETLNIEDCLAAINSISLGFSFGLPSLDDLLNMACEFAKDQIESKLQEASGLIEQQFSFSAYGDIIGADGRFGVGTDGSSTVDFEVNDTSGEIVDSIWRSIQ